MLYLNHDAIHIQLDRKMKPPFTLDLFLEIFRQYNEAVFPAQILLLLLALSIIYLVIRPTPNAGKWISGMLAFFWLWMGIVYHLIFFTTINKAAFLFGAVFVVQGFLFLLFGVFKNRLSFRFQSDIYGWTGVILIVFALLIYPLLGYAFDHIYPTSPTFGLPCPTTIFTFGVLLMTTKKCPVGILIIPFLWSIVGFSAAFHFGIIEDTGLLIAGLMTIPMIIMKNKARQGLTT